MWIERNPPFLIFVFLFSIPTPLLWWLTSEIVSGGIMWNVVFVKFLGNEWKHSAICRNLDILWNVFISCFSFEYSWLWLWALTCRNALFRSLDPMSLNCTFWKTGNFCTQHKDQMQGCYSALVFCWWYKPQVYINHKSLLVYEQQQQ